MRRAHLEEPALAALQSRCLDLGVRVLAYTYFDGDCQVRIDAQAFDEFDAAAAHVGQLEKAAATAVRPVVRPPLPLDQTAAA